MQIALELCSVHLFRKIRREQLGRIGQWRCLAYNVEIETEWGVVRELWGDFRFDFAGWFPA